MPLTRDFKQAVQARITRDRVYRKELLREGVECLLSGDVDTGKANLRDYIDDGAVWATPSPSPSSM